MGIMAFFFFLILCAMGPLLPTWMFLNSMQLIFHAPLIKSDMPSHAFYFMIEYLYKLRLHFEWAKQLSDDAVGQPYREDFTVLEQDSFYTS